MSQEVLFLARAIVEKQQKDLKLNKKEDPILVVKSTDPHIFSHFHKTNLIHVRDDKENVLMINLQENPHIMDQAIRYILQKRCAFSIVSNNIDTKTMAEEDLSKKKDLLRKSYLTAVLQYGLLGLILSQEKLNITPFEPMKTAIESIVSVCYGDMIETYEDPEVQKREEDKMEQLQTQSLRKFNSMYLSTAVK